MDILQNLKHRLFGGHTRVCGNTLQHNAVRQYRYGERFHVIRRGVVPSVQKSARLRGPADFSSRP